MPDLAQQPPDAGLGPLIGGMPTSLGPQLSSPPALQLNVPLPSSGASGPASSSAAAPKSESFPDYEQPFFNRLFGMESADKNVLYGGAPVPPGNVIPGAIGPTGQPTHAFGLGQIEPKTWNDAAAAARSEGRILNPHNEEDQKWVAHWVAARDFKVKTGKDFDAEAKRASETGDWSQIDAALQGTWPTLGRGGPRDMFTGSGAVTYGMTEAFQKQQALDQQHLATMHDEMAAIQKQMSEVNPDSQEYRKLLRQQIDASQAIEARYMQMAQNPPTRTMPDLFSGFGSLALLVAAIGGRHSRQPATASLNAAAGALQGIQQNNQQQFEDSFKTWQAQTQALNNALTAQNDVFRNILENEHLDESQRMEKLNEAFKLFDMSEASFALEHGMLDKAMQFPQTLATAQQNMELTNAQIEHLKAQTDNLAAGGNVTQHLDAGRLDANGNPTPYVQDKRGNTWTVQTQAAPDGTTQQVRTPYTPVRPSNLSSAPQGLPPEVKVPDRWEGMPNKAPPDVRQDVWDAALAAVQSGKLPTGGFGNSALKNQVTSLFPAAAHALGIPDSEIAQQWGKYQADVRRMTSVESAFGSGMAGRNLVSLNTVAAHLTLLREYAEALKNHDLPAANQIINRMSTQAGMPEVIQFALARTIAADEVVRLLTTTGGTVEDRAGLQRLLSEYGSPAQIFGAIDTAGQFVKERLGPLEQQYARNDPARRQEFEQNMLTPEARQLFLSQRSGGGGGQPKYSVGQIINTPKGKYRVIGGDLSGDPDVELMH